MSDPRSVFRQCYAAYLANDWDGFARLLADDVILQTSTSTIRGRDAVIAHHRNEKRAFPDIGGEYSTIAVSGNFVGGRKVIHGTHTGALPLADGREIQPSGRRFEVPESDWMEVIDGQCRHHWIYVDRMLTLQQLGLLPVADSARE